MTSSHRIRRLARAVGFGLVTAAVVSTLGFLVRVKFDPIIAADDAAIRGATAITRAHSGLFDTLIAWQWLFQPWRLYLVAVPIVAWVAWRHDLRTRGIWAFVTMMVGWNVALVFKYIFQRARPVVEDPVSQAPGYSFPSGHVSNVAIATTALVVMLWPVLSHAWRTVAVAAAGLLMVLTALDRVYLGVHYPSDTVGGILLGVGLVLSSYAGLAGWTAPDLPPDPER